jgi:hypothetical protein
MLGPGPSVDGAEPGQGRTPRKSMLAQHLGGRVCPRGIFWGGRSAAEKWREGFKVFFSGCERLASIRVGKKVFFLCREKKIRKKVTGLFLPEKSDKIGRKNQTHLATHIRKLISLEIIHF